MIAKTITLLAGARNVQVVETTATETTLTYTCPAWKAQLCIHKLPGQWEIKSIKLNKVTLVNHNQIIKENEKIFIK